MARSKRRGRPKPSLEDLQLELSAARRDQQGLQPQPGLSPHYEKARQYLQDPEAMGGALEPEIQEVALNYLGAREEAALDLTASVRARHERALLRVNDEFGQRIGSDKITAGIELARMALGATNH